MSSAEELAVVGRIGWRIEKYFDFETVIGTRIKG